jgi:eukaryotic-like serine/threonine-protein kinase
MFKSILVFLKTNIFVKHLAVYTLLLIITIWALLKWLDVYTKHGEYIKVPNFKGVPVSELKKISAKNNVTYLIIDSLFDAKVAPGIVVKQEPEFNAEVKQGREVYLYISAMLPPEIPMPKLIDRSLRQAISMISSFGLRLGKIEFVEDVCTNCVLEQRINGKKIKPGVIVSKGSAITLTAGKGTRDITVRMPCLYGLTKEEAIIRLAESSLAVGKSVFETSTEDLKAKIYKQVPSCDSTEDIDIGASIDIFLTLRESRIPKSPLDTITHKKKDDEDFDN